MANNRLSDENESHGLKLTMLMLNGTDDGPVTVEIGGWNGKAIFCPRAVLKNILSRKEFSGPCLYLLQSPSILDEYESLIYIGEGEIAAARLRQQIANGDFESVVCFFGPNLTKVHCKYLEAKLVRLARSANTCLIANDRTPRIPYLLEADISEMNFYIERIRMILPRLGIRALVPAIPRISMRRAHAKTHLHYHVKSKRVAATMVELNDAFVVHAGSQASATIVRSMSLGWRNLRKKLLQARILKPVRNRLLFVKDTPFSSPSAAASVVLGYQASGPAVWALEDGRTYKDVQT